MEMVVTFPGGKKVDSHYKGFTVHTDQPIEEGGTHTAPEPFDLFLASIGTCAGIYVASFCSERGIDPKDIQLVLRFDRNEVTHMVSTIHIDIRVPREFPEKYKGAVKRAAQLCFVKKHLESPPQFQISCNIKSD